MPAPLVVLLENAHQRPCIGRGDNCPVTSRKGPPRSGQVENYPPPRQTSESDPVVGRWDSFFGVNWDLRQGALRVSFATSIFPVLGSSTEPGVCTSANLVHQLCHRQDGVRKKRKINFRVRNLWMASGDIINVIIWTFSWSGITS